LAHGCRGFGWVSKSVREGRLLRQLEAAGIGCPQAIAQGEHAGRAFVLLREATGVDLRQYLQEHVDERDALARALGTELAHVHRAGFYHRDLYSKHILVDRDERGWRFCFHDWQRGRRVTRTTWAQRLRDLATLDATLASTLASRRDRLLCWHAYLAAQPVPPARPARLLRIACRLSERLQRKRRLRELRQPPLPAGQHDLIWFDGEALCVTRRFHEQMPDIPSWLAMPDPPPGCRGRQRLDVAGPEGVRWTLCHRWENRPGRWWLSFFRRPLFPAPEFEQAAAMIRLERYGIEVPRLLALGHRTLRPWQKYSFLLTEPPTGVVPLVGYLRDAAPTERWRVLREAGQTLRRIHEAGYACKGNRFDAWAIRLGSGAIVITNVEGLRRRSGSLQRLGRSTLTRLAGIGLPGLNATDKLRFFLGYHLSTALTAGTHRLARQLARWRHRQTDAARERRVA
jgi:tRNA A-37 threonylcarbamoyl transferase component Bud32